MFEIIIALVLFGFFAAAVSNAEKDNWPMFWVYLIIFIIGILNSPF